MSRTDPILSVVSDWRRRLHDDQAKPEDRRARAHLRRARSLDALLLLPDYYRFERGARAAGSYPHEGLRLLAALLPYLKVDTDTRSEDGEVVAGASFAQIGGTPMAESKRARLSEGRFRRLLASETRDELFGQLVRTLRLLDGTASLSALVRDVRRWYPDAQDHPRTRWARDYYTATLTDATPSDA